MRSRAADAAKRDRKLPTTAPPEPDRPMEVFRRLPPSPHRTACALTIGTFDGVHRGHQAVLAQLRARARARGLPACVLTFEPHPRDFFAAQSLGAHRAPPRIQSTRDKLVALADQGVDRVCIARFDAGLAQLTAERFFKDIIVDGLRTQELLVGDDFRFGRNREGDPAMLLRVAAEHGVSCARIESFEQRGVRVSSSAVRTALGRGDFARAAELLGRQLRISGHVLHGRKLGRNLGFPTINLRIPYARSALAGVFVVQVFGLGPRPLPGVASLGTRPAVERDGKLLLEVHLLDFSQQVYGQMVSVEFLHKLRDEAHYPTLEALTAQIALDTEQAREWFASHPDVQPVY